MSGCRGPAERMGDAMRISGAGLCAASFAVLTGCGAAQTPGGLGPFRADISTASGSAKARSWVAPEAKAQNLLYVADYDAGVLVFAYTPRHVKYVGLLNVGEPQGECVDQAQDVYVVSGRYDIFEYAHGGMQPIKILSDPVANPLSCAVDPTTGALAVVGYGTSQLVIFKPGRYKPRVYQYPGFGVMVSCTYDNDGNLFIDGNVVGGTLHLTELRAGSSKFEAIRLNQAFQGSQGGGLLWSESTLAVADELADVIYRFAIKRTKGEKIGATPLNGSAVVGQFAIDASRVIVPSTRESYAGFVKIYDYPDGGNATKTLLQFGYPDGVVVSEAPKQLQDR